MRYTGKPRAEQRLHWFWAAHLEEGNLHSNTVNEKKLQGVSFVIQHEHGDSAVR